jgi:hypothetical protein
VLGAGKMAVAAVKDTRRPQPQHASLPNVCRACWQSLMLEPPVAAIATAIPVATRVSSERSTNYTHGDSTTCSTQSGVFFC